MFTFHFPPQPNDCISVPVIDFGRRDIVLSLCCDAFVCTFICARIYAYVRMFLHVRVGSSHYAYAHVFVQTMISSPIPMTAEAPQQAPYTADVPVHDDPFPVEDAVVSARCNDGKGDGTSEYRHPAADDRNIGEPKKAEEEEEEEEKEKEEDFEGWWVLKLARRPNKGWVKPSPNEDGTALLLTRVPNDGSGVKQYKVQHFSGRNAIRGTTVEKVMKENATLVGKGRLAMTWVQYGDPDVHLTMGTKYVVADGEYYDLYLKEETNEARGETTRERESYWVFEGKPLKDNALDEWKERFFPGTDKDSETKAASSTTPVRAGNNGGGKGGWGPYATGSKGCSWNLDTTWNAGSQWGESTHA